MASPAESLYGMSAEHYWRPTDAQPLRTVSVSVSLISPDGQARVRSNGRPGRKVKRNGLRIRVPVYLPFRLVGDRVRFAIVCARVRPGP